MRVMRLTTFASAIVFATMSLAADLLVDAPYSRTKQFKGWEGSRRVLDGSGYTAGNVANPRISLIEETDARKVVSTTYRIDYEWYNGNGTWRGSQYLNFKAFDAFGTELESYSISLHLPRGSCYYGHYWPIYKSGRMPRNIYDLVHHYEITPTRVAGFQSEC